MLSPLYYYITWDVVKITLLVTYAFNAIMSLSRASTRGSYSRIEGVTHGALRYMLLSIYLSMGELTKGW